MLSVLGATCAVVCSSAVYAGLIPIDDFGGQYRFFSTFDPIDPSSPKARVVDESSGPGVLGVERDVAIVVNGTPLSLSGAGTLGDPLGVFVVATCGDAGSVITVQYDGDDPGQDTDAVGLFDSKSLGAVDLTDGGLNTAFLLDFKSLDAGDAATRKLNAKVTVFGDGGTATFDSATSGLGDIPESTDPFRYYIPFDEFIAGTGTKPLESADSITFVFNDAVSNIDFQLRGISAVPEPSTLLMAGMGILVFAAWATRRRRRRT